MITAFTAEQSAAIHALEDKGLIVQMGESDYRHGKRGSACKCPWALAIKRAMIAALAVRDIPAGVEVYVSEHTVTVRITHDRPPRDTEVLYFEVPRSVRSWIRLFDVHIDARSAGGGPALPTAPVVLRSERREGQRS